MTARTETVGDAHGKALSLNLDPSIYGTLAEIGAGQEVARYFLSVGAASGTVAKTICAYDKIVSDELYGAGARYVSKERLLAMLDREYKLLLERLGATRGTDTRFFVFADTAAVRSYHGNNEQHGWAGIRFQTEPASPISQILLHANLCDRTATQQQEAIGMLGVNLVYAAFHQRSDAEVFLSGLFDGLSSARMEIDVLEFEGPAFDSQDARLWRLELLRRRMAHAIVFDHRMNMLEPATLLRKRPVLIGQCAAPYPEASEHDYFESAARLLREEAGPFEREPVALLEIRLREGHESFPPHEVLPWIRPRAPAASWIVTGYQQTYLLSQYLRRYTDEPVRFIMSAAEVAKAMQEAFYARLPGAVLEGLGRLLATNVKLYVTPMEWKAFRAALGGLSPAVGVKRQGNRMVTLDSLALDGPARYLFEYLRASGRMLALQS